MSEAQVLLAPPGTRDGVYSGGNAPGWQPIHDCLVPGGQHVMIAHVWSGRVSALWCIVCGSPTVVHGQRSDGSALLADPADDEEDDLW